MTDRESISSISSPPAIFPKNAGKKLEDSTRLYGPFSLTTWIIYSLYISCKTSMFGGSIQLNANCWGWGEYIFLGHLVAHSGQDGSMQPDFYQHFLDI